MYSEVLIQWYIDRAKEAFVAKRFHVENRPKNNQTIINLGLTPYDIYAALMALEVSNYIEGPSPDRDRPGTPDFWKFRTSVYGKAIHIKMKIVEIGENKDMVKVVSFHIDEK